MMKCGDRCCIHNNLALVGGCELGCVGGTGGLGRANVVVKGFRCSGYFPVGTMRVWDEVEE